VKLKYMDCDLNPGHPECDAGASAVRLRCPVTPSEILCATRSIIVVLFGVVGLVKSRGGGGQGGTCSMRGREEKCIQGMDGKPRRKDPAWKS
jgi:hypothetical protein